MNRASNQIKRNFKYCCFLLILNLNVFAKPLAVIEINNDTKVDRNQVLITVPYLKIADKIGPEFPFKLVDKNTGKELPYQLETLGNSQPQNLLILLSCKANTKLLILINKGVPTAVKALTFGRYVPERLDDFAWENNKIAFRMYGSALETNVGNAFGIDVWAKRTPELVINKWYKNDDYHKDNGDGLDYYGVGKTMGAGDIATYVKDSIGFTNNYKTWKVLDNGPLRTTFELSYLPKNAGNLKYIVAKRISIDAGSQLNKVDVKFAFEGNSKLPIIIGIAKRNGADAILLNKEQNMMGYWEPNSIENGTIGVGCIFLSPAKSMEVKANQLISTFTVSSNQTFAYYTGASWSKAQEISNSMDWFNYLTKFNFQIQHPLLVTIL
jgi:hypothetical protein